MAKNVLHWRPWGGSQNDSPCPRACFQGLAAAPFPYTLCIVTQTCFLAPQRRVWVRAEMQKSSIFMGGSFKIRFECLSSRFHLILVSNRFLFALDVASSVTFDSKMLPKSIHDRFDASKNLHLARNICFDAHKTRPRAAQKLPRLPQGAPKEMQKCRNH